jgi:hypothetical protein
VPNEEVATKGMNNKKDSPSSGEDESLSVAEVPVATSISETVSQHHHHDSDGTEEIPSIASLSENHGDNHASEETLKANENNQVVHDDEPHTHGDAGVEQKAELGRNPGEKAFFKLLHAEHKKATHFFDKAQEEFMIREERVREGMQIMMQPNSIMVNEKWSMLAKSIYRLYKDLLLLETFAIMTYCSFSKILKKHDKMTGYQTRNAFMANVVNKANFTNYPKVLQMISSCKQLYEEVSHRLVLEGKNCLYEDERLFINMISRLNAQAHETAESEGAPDRGVEYSRRSEESKELEFSTSVSKPAANQESSAISTLRSLVEENDALARAAQVAEDQTGDEVIRKRSCTTSPTTSSGKKTRRK